MTKHKNDSSGRNPVWLIILGMLSLTVVLSLLLKGTDIALLNPKGLIAGEERSLMLLVTAVLLLIAVPTLFLFYFFAWKFRETNKKAIYDPQVRHGRSFIIYAWLIPSVFMVVLSVIMLSATHRLEPQDAIASTAKPLTIQVVALPWKWLFIYPEQKIASVNFVQIPVGTPVHFELTADKVSMSSFWIPHLSGQLYAMTGHINRLNLIADIAGDYPGSSAEINGPGFAGMKFIARATTQGEFDSWAGSIGQSYAPLSNSTYQKLLTPTENHPYDYYSNPQAGLYDAVIMKYSDAHGHTPKAAHDDHNEAGH